MDYDKANEMKEFHETKAGVKGLVDSGIVKIPKYFIHSSESLLNESDNGGKLPNQVPIIDLEGVNGTRRRAIIEEIHKALEKWGFFQMVNHGIPMRVLDEMIEGVRRFHEQPTKEKSKLYNQELEGNFEFTSIGVVKEFQAADWRDSTSCFFDEDQLDFEIVPLVCREQVAEYVGRVIKLKDLLCELFSEALGLSHDYLKKIECMNCLSWNGHYYPGCPEPDKTLGTVRHTDPCPLTLLLQDQIGGLQVFHQNQWVDVTPIKGAIIANTGDLLQLITNDKFKSVEHRVLTNPVGPRISVATLFCTKDESKSFGPIKELLSEDDPPVYKETTIAAFNKYYFGKGNDGNLSLPHFKL